MWLHINNEEMESEDVCPLSTYVNNLTLGHKETLVHRVGVREASFICALPYIVCP